MRPQFLRAFLDSQISAIGWFGDEPPVEEDHFIAEEGDTLHLQHMEFEGRNVLPVFTSPERIAANAPGAQYVALAARDLLEMNVATRRPGTACRHIDHGTSGGGVRPAGA